MHQDTRQLDAESEAPLNVLHFGNPFVSDTVESLNASGFE
jgi:hypothetical protein